MQYLARLHLIKFKAISFDKKKPRLRGFCSSLGKGEFFAVCSGCTFLEGLIFFNSFLIVDFKTGI
jgi:hypothetical protein